MALPSRDEAQVELAGLGYSLFELWAIAAQNAHVRHPEVFGSIEDLGAWQERIEDLKERRQTLFARIQKEYTPDDLLIGEIRSDGAALIAFRLAPGMVPVAPLRDCGERLVSYLLRTAPENWQSLRENKAGYSLGAALAVPQVKRRNQA